MTVIPVRAMSLTHCLPGNTCLTCWTNCQRGSDRVRWHATHQAFAGFPGAFLVQLMMQFAVSGPKSRQPHFSYSYHVSSLAFILIFRWLMCILRGLDCELHEQVGSNLKKSVSHPIPDVIIFVFCWSI